MYQNLTTSFLQEVKTIIKIGSCFLRIQCKNSIKISGDIVKFVNSLHSTKSCTFHPLWIILLWQMILLFFPSYGWITISRLACVQVFRSLLFSLWHSLVLVRGSNVEENSMCPCPWDLHLDTNQCC